MTDTKAMAPAAAEPGVYTGMSFEDYIAIPAANATTLGWMERSPAYAHWKKQHEPTYTDATMLGSAAHCAALEPGRFSELYALEPDPAEVAPDAKSPRATKAYKDAVAALEATGRAVLKDTAYRAATMIASKVRGHRRIRKLLDTSEAFEEVLVWEESGHLCKARLDSRGPGFIFDLKTTRDHVGFSPWIVTKYGLYRQAAWYRRGAKSLGLPCLDHYFLGVVANTPPHETSLYRMDDLAISAGDAEVSVLFQEWCKCTDADEWPGDHYELKTAEITDTKFREIFPEEGI